MMPWEHAIVGYICYSLFVHAVYREAPTGRETVVVVFASVLPDLIDKPLAWEFGVFESGYAIGHSIFVAVPLSLLVLFVAYQRGWPRAGWAFSIGYLVHLPSDVIPMYLQLGYFPVARILWPVRQAGGPSGHGLGVGFWSTLETYVEVLGQGPESPYAMLVLGLVVFVIALWIYDGMPVARESYRWLRRTD